jgi:hypothetical protein
MNLSKLLIIHGIVTFAAGIVLTVAPGLIPGMIGVHIDKGAYIICYLLASSEFSLAVLSLMGAALTDVKALRAIVLACVVLHTSSALLEIYAYTQGLSAGIWWNVLLRVVVTLLFLYFGFYKTKPKAV